MAGLNLSLSLRALGSPFFAVGYFEGFCVIVMDVIM